MPRAGPNHKNRLRELSRKEGKTIAMVTHSSDAASKADRLLHCHDGKITE